MRKFPVESPGIKIFHSRSVTRSSSVSVPNIPKLPKPYTLNPKPSLSQTGYNEGVKSVRTIILPVALAFSFVLGFLLRSSIVSPSVQTDSSFASGEYRVTHVFDGDTIEVEGGIRIRYDGIDALELHERYGTAAYELNKRLVSGRTVRVDESEGKKDIYGRTLGYVYAGDVFVNAKLVEEGYATAVSYDKTKKSEFYERFLALQREAQQGYRGMWVENMK